MSLFFIFGIGRTGWYSIPKLARYSVYHVCLEGVIVWWYLKPNKVMICFLTGFVIIYVWFCPCDHSFTQMEIILINLVGEIHCEKVYLGIVRFRIKAVATPIFRHTDEPYYMYIGILQPPPSFLLLFSYSRKTLIVKAALYSFSFPAPLPEQSSGGRKGEELGMWNLFLKLQYPCWNVSFYRNDVMGIGCVILYAFRAYIVMAI